MSIKKINNWIAGLFSLLALVTFISLSLANYYRNEQVKTLDVQLKSLLLSQQLSEGSDFLTNTVRAFSSTGDSSYDDLFAEEITVKRSRDLAVAGLRKLGATTNELQLIEIAKNNSDQLINLENQAFAAGRSGNLDLARSLVYGAVYRGEKAKIMESIHAFQQAIELRLAEEVKTISWRADTSLRFSFFIVFIMVLMVFLSQHLFYRRKVVVPLVRLNTIVSVLTIEKREAELNVFTDSSEISTLAKTINEFHSNALLAADLQKLRLHIAEMTAELYKAQDFSELTDIVMTDISSFLGVRHGLLYVADQTEQYLTLVGGYGVPISAVGNRVLFGEGLVGQCAFTQVPVHMNTLPVDYVKIASATGSAEAKCIFILPLVLNKRLMGVIELASFRQFDENDQLVLTEICFALAMSIGMLSHKNS